MHEQMTIPEGYLMNHKGHLVPEGQVHDTDKLEDQTVRTMFAFAEDLNKQIGRFKAHCYEDIEAFMAVLQEKYQVTKGGKKGNKTFTSFDGLMKVTIAVQDRIDFGPQLEIAKQLFDECISKWAEETNANIRALVEHAFRVEQGQINRSALFGLRRINITDEEWLRAMQALNDSIRIISTTEYIRFHRRETRESRWKNITIDLASATPLFEEAKLSKEAGDD